MTAPGPMGPPGEDGLLATLLEALAARDRVGPASPPPADPSPVAGGPVAGGPGPMDEDAPAWPSPSSEWPTPSSEWPTPSSAWPSSPSAWPPADDEAPSPPGPGPADGSGPSAAARAELGWSPPLSWQLDDRGAAATRPTDAVEETCVFVGPSGAGKTCTLAALSAACYGDPVDPDCTMAVLNDPVVDQDDRLSQYAANWIGHGDLPPATEQRRSYQIEIATRIAGRGLRAARMVVTSLRCSDGPGGTLFPSRDDLRQGGHMTPAQTAELLAQAAAATTLVLVIDSTAPAVELIETHLPGLLDRIARASPGEELAQPLWVRVLHGLRLGRHRSAPRRSRVAARRVLLLLTKVDALAHAWSDRDTTPRQMAAMLDPLALALDLVGERTLRRIRRGIGVQAELAVALTSASGFHRDGQTFLDWSRDQGADARMKAWTPYGIHEALLYITTGRWGGPVQRIGADDPLWRGDALPLSTEPLETS